MAERVAEFGRLADGRAVQAVTLRGQGLTARLLTLGAILQDLRLDGVAWPLTLGSDRLADYAGPLRYFGAIVGPVANRIGGARVVIDGRTHAMEANEGPNSLHSGQDGIHAQLWTVEDAGPVAVRLALALQDGAGGLPGNRRIAATVSLPAPGTLRLEIEARSDAATPMNPAQHSYWNLDGSAHWQGHALQVLAGRITPVTAALLPTGVARPVAGTPFDLRRGRLLVPGVPDLDTNFCLDEAPRPLAPAAVLTGASGVSLVLSTTAPGLQVYDGRNALRPGRGPCEGIALEPQHWPDAPNHRGFPPILLRPGETWRQVSEWRFAAG
jgi:aldose 1-epimerase